MIWKKSNPYLNKQDNISTRYDYKNNQYVKSVEVFWKGYDPYTDSEMTEVQVVSCDESVFRWESKTISSYGNGLWIDRFGKYIFGCSLRGIYCLDVKTGQPVWKSQRRPNKIIMNSDDTITGQGIQSIYTLDLQGKLVNEVKTRRECSIDYLGENHFLIAFNAKTCSIIQSGSLKTVCTIPINVFSVPDASRFRFAKKEGNYLYITYWSPQKQTIDLTPYLNLSEE